ncbi:MAG: hypothetical protein ACOX2Q_01500 [Dehalobacterium sp.]|jgi:hypothetical protein
MILLYGAFIYFALLEIPGMLKRKAWKEGMIWMGLWSIGLLIGTLDLLKVQLPFLGSIILELILELFPFLNSI